MGDDISKDHSRRAIKYIEDLSNGDVTAKQILEEYKKFRKERDTRGDALSEAMLFLLDDKITNGLQEDRDNPDKLVFEYKRFPYRLEVYGNGTNGYDFVIWNTYLTGQEYKVDEGYRDKYIEAVEEAVVSLVDEIVNYAIFQTRDG